MKENESSQVKPVWRETDAIKKKASGPLWLPCGPSHGAAWALPAYSAVLTASVHITR